MGSYKEECSCNESGETPEINLKALDRLARERLYTLNAEKLNENYKKQQKHFDALKEATKIAMERCEMKKLRRKYRTQHYLKKAQKKILAAEFALKKDLLIEYDKEQEEESETESGNMKKISPKNMSPNSQLEKQKQMKGSQENSKFRMKTNDNQILEQIENSMLTEFTEIIKEDNDYEEAVREYVNFELMSETDLSITTTSAVESITMLNKFPLTNQTHTSFDYNLRESAAWIKKQKEKKEQKCQERIHHLKEELDRHREEFKCHLDVRLQKAAEIEEKCKEKLKQSLKIDATLPPKTTTIIVDKIRKFRKDKLKFKKAQQDRYNKIIEKILKEDYIFKKPKTTFRAKGKKKQKVRNKKFIENKIYNGNDQQYDMKIPENDYYPEYENSISLNLKPSPLFNEFPIEEWYSILEEDSLSKPDLHIGLANETNLVCHPSLVHFKNFEPNFIYRKKLTLLNKGSFTLFIRLSKIELNDDDDKVIEIKPQDVTKLLPGLNFIVLVKFAPWKCTKELKGAIIFITWRNPLSKPIQERQRFVVPILCEKIKAEPFLDKNFVKFPPVAVWNVKRGGFCKKFQVSNHGHKACVLRITSLDSSKNILNEQQEEIFIGDGTGDHEEMDCSVLLIMTTISHSIGQCIDNIFEKFRWEMLFCVHLPAHSNIDLKISFNPRGQCGFFQQQFEFEFIDIDDDSTLLQAQVEASAEVFGLPLTLDTPVLDLGLVTTDGLLAQSLVTARTSSRVPIEVEWRVPKKLSSHVQIIPRRAYVHPEPRSSTVFIVRLQPSWQILKNHMHYDPESSILDFSCRMYALSPPYSTGCSPISSGSWAGSKPLLLRVLATVTSPDFLNIEPAQIELGSVCTNETISIDLKLTNYSLAKLNYGFFNVPKNVCIMPGYGFGEILSGQELNLRMLYSPKKEDIENNKENYSCIEGPSFFQIEVRSLESLGGTGEGIRNLHLLQNGEKTYEIESDEDDEDDTNELKENGQKEKKNFNEEQVDKDGLPNFDSENTFETFSPETTVSPLLSALDELLAAIEKPAPNYESNSLKVPKLSSKSSSLETLNEISSLNNTQISIQEEENEVKQIRYQYQINVRAWVIDPKCQLDINRIVFPVTPCLGYSIASVKLRCQDLSCLCGFQNFNSNNLYIWFESRSVSKYIDVQPRQGTLTKGEEKKLNIIFKPTLEKNKIEEQAKEMKKIRQEIEKRMSTNEKKKKDKTTKDISQEVTKSDLYTAEKFLLETFEPYKLETKVIILIKTAFSLNEPRQTEMHPISLTCPVSRPLFLVNLPTQLIDFGSVNIGCRPHFHIPLYNIARRSIIVKSSLANPVGDLFLGICTRNGIVIESGFVGIVPITYSPLTETEINEYIEFYSESTLWKIHVTGRGVLPKYQVLPDTNVWRLEYPNKTIEIKIDVINNGELPLEFDLELDDSLMTLNKDTRKMSLSKKFDETLNEKEQELLDDGSFFKVPYNIGELWIIKDPSIICPPKSSKKLKINFTPPIIETPKLKNIKPIEDSTEIEDPTKSCSRIYLAKCSLILNKLTKIRDLYMIVSKK